MEPSIELESCLALLREGQLTEDKLRECFAGAKAADSSPKVQSLMYAAAYDTNVFSGLVALSIIEAGHRRDIPAQPNQWPYRSVAQAMGDGWRIIKFPDFVPDESRNYGLGCEFILER